MFVFRKTLFSIIMAPNRKSSDAGSASKPKRSCDVLSISEKVKILNMIEINKKNLMRRFPGCMARKNRPFVKSHDRSPAIRHPPTCPVATQAPGMAVLGLSVC
jgi:hypothetical protein